MLAVGEVELGEAAEDCSVVVVVAEMCWAEEETVGRGMLWVKGGVHWTMGG